MRVGFSLFLRGTPAFTSREESHLVVAVRGAAEIGPGATGRGAAG